MGSVLGTKLAECLHVESKAFTDFELLGKCTQHIMELREENEQLKAKLEWAITELNRISRGRL